MIYQNSKSYLSTNTWGFKVPKNDMGPLLEVTVGRNKTNGILMLQNEMPRSFSIKGPIILYLSNGEVLHLTKIITKDYVDESFIVLFFINEIQISVLKLSDIINIRFTISCQCSLGDRSFRAINPKSYIEVEYIPGIKSRIDTEITYYTSTEISKLFEE